MNILFLAGNGYHNKEWVYKLCETVAPLFDKSLVHDYAHWNSDEEFINFDTELDVLSEELKDFGEYVVFAKSIGSVLASLGMSRGIIKPTKFIVAGLPLGLIVSENHPVGTWLENDTTKLIVVQNTNDPLGSFDDVRDYIGKIKKEGDFELVELPGDSHDYSDLEKLKEIIGS